MALSPAERMKRWRERNPDVAKSRHSAWLGANPDYALKWQRENRDKTKRANRKHKLRKIGFTPEMVDLLLERQEGACDICRRVLSLETHKIDSVQADHDHETKEARGLLCVACNTGLGYYEKHQRPQGLSIACYDVYLADPPTRRLV